jgi:hypothetical protein
MIFPRSPRRRSRQPGPALVGAVVAALMLACTALTGSGSEPRGWSAVSWGEWVVVASGGGYRGPWRMNDSVYEYVDDPSVAITAEGAVVVVFADQARQDVFVQVYEAEGGERFAEPVNVSRSAGIFSWLPRVASSPGEPDELHVLWQDIVFSGEGSHGGEIFYARSRDGGATFSEPQNLSNSPEGDGKGRLDRERWHNGSLDLVTGPEGAVWAAWTEFEGRLWCARRDDAGDALAPPVHVGGDEVEPARGPSLAVGSDGLVYLFWTVGEDPEADLRLAVSSDGGRTFDAPRPIFRRSGHADAPSAVVDGSGAVHLVFAEASGGPGGRSRVLYSRSDDAGASFAEPSDLSGWQGESFASVGFPALGLDERDGLYVVWETFPDLRRRPVGLGLTFSGDGGRTFASPAVVPGSDDPARGINGSQQGLLMRKLAVGPGGALAIVNSSFNPGVASHVWLLRGQVDVAESGQQSSGSGPQ